MINGWTLADGGERDRAALMNLYRRIINEICQENEQLLLLLGISTLGSGLRLPEEESRLRGPDHISQLMERNQRLRGQLSATLPALDIDAYLRRECVH
jgi:hypothetical protein